MSRTGVAHWRVPLGFALAAIYVLVAKPTRVSLLVGVPIAAIGLWTRAAAAGHIRKNDTLATTGPYRYTRNPLYLGSVILALGFVIAAAQWLLGLLAAALLMGVYLPVIRQEEAYLAAKFGAEFETYAQRVPRLLPRLNPARAERGTEFSFHLYRRHREYNALLGFVLMVVYLWAAYHWGSMLSHL